MYNNKAVYRKDFLKIYTV